MWTMRCAHRRGPWTTLRVAHCPHLRPQAHGPRPRLKNLRTRVPNTLNRPTTDRLASRRRSQVAPGSYLLWKRLSPHNGAWKIAYADFVTAMMAFFLLMWLLGSTSEGDKKGIAEYFQSPLKVALVNGGSGSGDSSSSLKGGGQDLTKSSGQVKRGDVPAPRNTVNLQALRQEQRVAEAAQLRRSASSWRPSSKTTRSLPSTRHRSSST